MKIANERGELLSKFLTEDKERALKLLELDPEEAVKQINSFGYDFTAEEVETFGAELIAMANQEGELSEEALEQTSGGLVVTAGVLAAGVALFGAGLSSSVAIGIAVANHKKW